MEVCDQHGGRKYSQHQAQQGILWWPQLVAIIAEPLAASKSQQRIVELLSVGVGTIPEKELSGCIAFIGCIQRFDFVVIAIPKINILCKSEGGDGNRAKNQK